MNTNLLSMIRELNNNSKIEEILKVLLYDVKQMAILDPEKVLRYNKKIKNVSLEYNNDDEYAKNIKNTERYKIGISYNYYTKRFDADKEPIVKELLIELIRNCKDVHSVKDLNSRTILVNDEIYLDTDTMNSFQTSFGNYIKVLHPDYLKEYMEKYNLKKGTVLYRNSYFIEECANWFRNQKDQTMYELFELFALLVYTFGNFMLIPRGYNRKRYQVTRDIINLSFDDIVKRRDTNKNFKWYTKHYSEMGFEPILKYDTKTTSIEENEAYNLFTSENQIVPKKEGQIKDYINNVCKIILLRGIKILKDINSELITNIELNDFENKIRNSQIITEVFK